MYYENTLSGETQWDKPFGFVPVVRHRESTSNSTNIDAETEKHIRGTGHGSGQDVGADLGADANGNGNADVDC